MERNVGTVDSYLRLTSGLLLLAWGTARLVKMGANGWTPLVLLLGATKVAEGITRVCPLLSLFGVSTSAESPACPEIGGE